MRIAGSTIPDDKRLDIALTYIYGIGRKNVQDVLKSANVDGAIRAKNLSEEDQKKIQQALETYRVEGDLRAQVTGNVRRLRDIGSYRGMRHSKNLPSRGQRTRTNARTKRGKRMTIKKEMAAKMGIGSAKEPAK